MDLGQFEPTVLGAVRRYWLMVLSAALIAAVAAVAYSIFVPKKYRAEAEVTMPPTSSSQGESGDQYLESQVLLLKSRDVADRAASLANADVDEHVLVAADFSPDRKSLKITTPEGASAGAYGSGIVAVSFTWPDARVAQAGTNAVLRAFDDARIADITAQGEATVAGIDKAIMDARTRGHRTDLVNQRTKMLVSQQIDLAHHPTVVWATEPQVPINGDWKRFAAIGLVVGGLVGALVAYLRASRRPLLEDRFDPAAIYDAPLIVELPAGKRWTWTPQTDPLPLAADPQSIRSEVFRFAARYVERIRASRGNQLSVTFVSAAGGTASSSVVANIALAAAESGASVLAIDANSTSGALTALLLPGNPRADGLDQVLIGQRSVSECVQASPLNQRLSVLGRGHPVMASSGGAGYSSAVEETIGKAKASFDLVLVDSPALLRVADAAELVDKSDTVIVVASLDELVRDHVSMRAQFDLLGCEVNGYIFERTRGVPWYARQVGEGPIAARRAISKETTTW
jgi:Mrp family chromosome partitioning ATPase